MFSAADMWVHGFSICGSSLNTAGIDAANTLNSELDGENARTCRVDAGTIDAVSIAFRE
jgi:hypothetical protein